MDTKRENDCAKKKSTLRQNERGPNIFSNKNKQRENEEEKMNSLSGIRTPVFHVTGEDT